MASLSDLNEMTEFVERIASRTAELTVAKLSETVRGEIAEVREIAVRAYDRIYGDNGDGLIQQVQTARRDRESCRADCDTALAAVRKLALDASAAPQRTVQRWKWMLAGAGGLGGGIYATLEVLYRLHLMR